MSGGCEREEAVVRALLEDRLTGELESHVAGCPECRETVAVTAWMRDVARAAREAAAEGLPDASEIWGRAEVLARVDRRHDLVERAVRPIDVFERGMGVVAAAIVALLAWFQADRLFESGWPTELAEALSDPERIAVAGVAAVAVLVLSTGVLLGRLSDL